MLFLASFPFGLVLLCPTILCSLSRSLFLLLFLQSLQLHFQPPSPGNSTRKPPIRLSFPFPAIMAFLPRTTPLLLRHPPESLTAARTHALRNLSSRSDVAPRRDAVACQTALDSGAVVEDRCCELSFAGCEGGALGCGGLGGGVLGEMLGL